MKDFFLKMLDYTNPTVSSSRFLSIITTISILYTWMFVSIYSRTIVEIPVGVYTFAGLVIAGSVGNKAFEKVQTGSSQTMTETMTKTTVDKDVNNN